MNEGQQIFASDLTPKHHGWLIKIPNSAYEPDRVLSGPSHRTITLSGVRRWIYADQPRVGLLGLETGQPYRGTEFHLPADAPVTLVRQIKRGIPRPREKDYPEQCPPLCAERSHPEGEHDQAEHGCLCWRLCTMGPTCPGANAGLDRGCDRARGRPPRAHPDVTFPPGEVTP
jgi:hypothetical protein